MNQPLTLHKQQGVTLLILAVIIVLAFVSYTVSDLSINAIKNKQAIQTRQALQDAKQALLAYAVNYPEVLAMNGSTTIRGPGYMPCPDVNNNGKGGVHDCDKIGRLPWKTLGIDTLYDGSGEALWYVVSKNFGYDNTGGINKINTATTGSLTIKNNLGNIIFDGTSRDAIVAVIIAPGKPLRRDDGEPQNRSLNTPDINEALNYLDNLNGVENNAVFSHDSLNGFIQGKITDNNGGVIINDEMILITYNDVMDLVHKKVAAQLKNVLTDYFDACGEYPDAAAFDPDAAEGDYKSVANLKLGYLPVDETVGKNGCPNNKLAADLPQWFEAESWHKETYYHNVATALGCIGGACLADVADASRMASVLVVFSGRALPAQSRGIASSATNDYFEADNNDGDLVYDSSQQDDYIGTIAP